MTNKLLRAIRKGGNGGFTLIEALVAVLILTTGIAGPLTIASKSLTSALVAKDQTTAFFLAQDAVEYVRFVRDSNKLAGADWFTGAGGTSAGTDMSSCRSADGSAVCYVDSIQNTVTNSVPSGCSNYLRYNASQGYYGYGTSGTACTIFNRTVKITSPVGGRSDEAKLVVQVSWNDTGGTTRMVTVTEELFNWQ
ncbi:MAG TPA: prepilin-type N-terminal cleavage/methylation domain-containing protein [Candidatus Paceibacterota bacterium]|nr:prepilin-type N-terminal cleavage/methylation domain-containing protein [Candidatus Paceibacterota bacterium]